MNETKKLQVKNEDKRDFIVVLVTILFYFILCWVIPYSMIYWGWFLK